MNRIKACQALKLNDNQILDLSIVKKAYRKLSTVYHPDKGGNNEKMILINQAYKFLITDIQKPIFENQANSLCLFNDLFNFMLANYLLAYSRYTATICNTLP